jgi:hypothetical protein
VLRSWLGSAICGDSGSSRQVWPPLPSRGGAQTVRCPLLIGGRKLLGGIGCSWGGRRGRQGRGLERCITRRGTLRIKEDGGRLGYKKRRKKCKF